MIDGRLSNKSCYDSICKAKLNTTSSKVNKSGHQELFACSAKIDQGTKSYSKYNNIAKN